MAALLRHILPGIDSNGMGDEMAGHAQEICHCPIHAEALGLKRL